MPTPFMCHWCDKPTMNESGICIECEQRYEEGNKDIAVTIRELETRIRWLEKGLKEIKAQTLCLDDMIQSILDGEPTTADEENERKESERKESEDNVVYISDVNKEIAKEWKNDTMQEDEIENYEDEHTCKHGNSRASNCSDCDCEEKIDLKNRKREKKINMITSIGYRGEE
jgi:hypothetical protein